jgi:hypothetical protein
MATLKTIIQGFCYRINLPAPSSFVGVNSPAEQQYLSIFRSIGDNLRNRPYNWPQLKRGYTFTTQTGVRDYQLPGDFYRILESGQWDQTNHWPLRGPISDYNYNVRQFAVVSLQTRKAFRLIGPTNYLFSTAPYVQRSAGHFEIDPAGGNDTDQLFLGYVSGNWLWPEDWVAATVYAANSVVSGNGFTYITTAGGTSGSTRPSHTTGSQTDGGVTWAVWQEPFLLDSSNTKLTDNCLCLFDDDLMIDGMIWAYKRAKGQDFQTERADWEQAVKNTFARFNGPMRINMADEFGDYFDWPNVPPGSWNV